ncbi:hypothetical protein C8J27_11456 [Rhodobacter aestuarii]|uniref:Uncharacterized protein n=1 Tax=Rhodobacter aestuarii TaxID=453582 RepID=A0A1N7QDZ7_9RHOB|nr:hypothetical protein C8J27_11456 [Rhodobacter aestuarii]SIT21083.1 hypothetical protein SAMN05421580_11656 [Rhodobacter aestuarii]
MERTERCGQRATKNKNDKDEREGGDWAMFRPMAWRDRLMLLLDNRRSIR